MSNCSQIFSAEALLRSVHEMAERITELHDLRRRVREAEARARARRWHKSSTRPRRRREFHRLQICKDPFGCHIGARRLDGPAPLKFDGLEQARLW